MDYINIYYEKPFLLPRSEEFRMVELTTATVKELTQDMQVLVTIACEDKFLMLIHVNDKKEGLLKIQPITIDSKHIP